MLNINSRDSWLFVW